uniref:sensor histidine kinase n=1 Tax=Paractinoplanes polyasparticus TaxID=2856853 RepID=UPI001C8609BC|nr:ATP-binding protein [Actinoplanes polyasparticus]
MSFRVRVFLLVAFVALGATTVTAALILDQADNQVREAVSASQETTELIRQQLLDKAVLEGTWQRVDQTVTDLRDRTGQRIRLVDPWGTVLVDTDHLEGRAARPPGAFVQIVDPTPTLILRADDPDPHATTLKAVRSYRNEVLFAACLFDLEYGVEVVTGPDGLPRHLLPPDVGREETGCTDQPVSPEQEREDRLEIQRCGPGASGVVPACLQAAFRRQIAYASEAPQPLTLTVGAANEPARGFDAGPILLITVIVAVLVTGGALLISRRVLSPISTLTAAVRSLGSGDRFGRVPDTARDELGELSRAFNQMADSVRAADADQRRLIADVAHELRTPLANLRGYLEAMQDGVLDPTPELFASLHDEVIHNQRIVDDLQELALAEAGALVYHKAPTDLAELLETVRTAHRADLVVEAPGPLMADVDADRIRQAVSNLVGNALRATSAGGSVTLRARAAGDRAVLEVVDTGTGIAAEHLPLVFDRLWRADPARGRDSGGSGLGLAIVRQIVRDHGGEVTVRSTPGEGSTFVISLPRTT